MSGAREDGDHPALNARYRGIAFAVMEIVNANVGDAPVETYIALQYAFAKTVALSGAPHETAIRDFPKMLKVVSEPKE